MKLTAEELQKMITSAIATELPTALKKIAEELTPEEVEVAEPTEPEAPKPVETPEEPKKPDPTIKNITKTSKKTLNDVSPRAKNVMKTLLMGKPKDEETKK